MKRFLLDTSALLTLRDDEPGARRVAELLPLAQQGKAKCYGCFMSLMEVLYRVGCDEGKPAGQLAHQQCLALPSNGCTAATAFSPKPQNSKRYTASLWPTHGLPHALPQNCSVSTSLCDCAL